MIKRMLVMLACLAALFGGVFGWKVWVDQRAAAAQASATAPPVAVTATEVAARSWTPVIPADGSLQATQAVNVSTEVAGIVQRIDIRSGEAVEAGDVILSLDASQDRADLEVLQAAQSLADIRRKRQRRLLTSNSTSESEVDEADSGYDQARARVTSQQALIHKKIIRAPFAGRLAIRQVNLGEYLAPGDVIIGLQSLDPIYADFTLPEQRLADVVVGQPVRVRVAAYPDSRFDGEITAIDAAVNVATRGFAVRATLDNDDGRLRGGMFATIEVVLPEMHDVLTLPQTAITYNPYGNSVYVLREKTADDGAQELIAERVFVTTGDTRGDQIAIAGGLEAGQRVVTTGQLKLKNGSRVIIDNTLQPNDQPHPRPPDG